ncbi:MAG: metallophosphoesterase family protein [Cognatishimia sp.]
MTNPIYAIGDIHGHLDQLETALARIHADGGPNAQIVFLGDYIDRGPASAQIIDVLIQAQADNRPWTMLKGNHDTYPAMFIETGKTNASKGRPELSWFDPVGGGAAFMASYGIPVADRPLADIRAQAQKTVPQAHLDFLKTRPLSYETADHFFAHAGICPGRAFADQLEEDLIWIRDAFLDDTRDHGKLVIHGHSARPYPEHRGNRVNLDGGAGFGRELIPAVFQGRKAALLTAQGRVPLDPNLAECAQ